MSRFLFHIAVVCLALCFLYSQGSGHIDIDTFKVEDKMYRVVQVFDSIYGNTKYDSILTDIGYKNAVKSGGNNVPRSLAATALAYSFIFRIEGKEEYLHKSIGLINALLEKHPLWTAKLKKPSISFNLAPTTAYNIGIAVWLIWDEIDEKLKKEVQTIMVNEADYQLLRLPATGHVDDTKAEENSIVPALLVLASHLSPFDPNAIKWEEHARCFAYHTITTKKDSSYCGLKTVTAYDDFTMDNHNFGPHPLYMAAPLLHFGDAALIYFAIGKKLPWEFSHNALSLWNKLKTFINPDFSWSVYSSWQPTGLSREITAATFVAVVLGVDKEIELKLLDYKIEKKNNFVEKEVSIADNITEYTEDWFNNCLVVKRYIVSILLHNQSYLLLIK